MGAPRVTLGFTTYNVERYLPQAFDAVLAQDYPDFEVVVCDNRSTDATWEICQQYAAKDDRFRIYQNPTNLGESGNFARVVSLARGELFRLTAHDDLIAPTLLSRCVAALDAAGPAAVLAYPEAILIDSEGREIGPLDYPGDLRVTASWRRTARMARLASYGCNEVFGVIRTEVLRRTRLFLPIASSDVVLLAELAARGQFVRVPERLFLRRVHEQSTWATGRDDNEVGAWLEPSWRPGAAGFRHLRIMGHASWAMLRSELPWPSRVSSATAFATVYGVRRARVWLGAQRRRLVGRAR